VDLTADSKNCGRCGYECLGGTCASGQCQPVLIAQYTGEPEIIYVGSQYVYATTDIGYIGRANKDGSDLKPFAMPGFASSAFNGTTVAEDGDRVFLVRYSGSTIQLSFCLTSGCDSTATAIGGPYTQYFAVDQVDHKLVWVDYSPSRFMTASTAGVWSAADVSGGALTSGSNGSRLLYAYGGIFFADGNGVSRIPVVGGAIGSVTYGTGRLTILGANSSSLFLYDGSSIGSIPLPSGDGGMPKPVITTALNPNVDGHFAGDDSSIYWVNNGSVETCELSRCASSLRTLPKRAQDEVEDVGIDDAAVYWLAADSTGGSLAGCTVSKLAR
jgi:hypothetical protein